MPDKEDRGFRLLQMYDALNSGAALEKMKLTERFGVSEKTAQRDIEDLRAYLAEAHGASVLVRYDKAKNEYRLVRSEKEWMTNEEILALCKILLESRAFQKEELEPLLGKLLRQVSREERNFIKDMIRNEMFCYVPLRHGKQLLASIWALSKAICNQEITEFQYTRQDEAKGTRRVKPVALMFSEFYFYLIAYFADDSKDFPAVFRVDRIESIRGTGEKFRVPYSERFKDGEFRKRVQFMYAGELRKVTFDFRGDSIEAVMDRLPTAEILAESDGTYTVTVEAFGKGIDMWLRSQGDFVRNLRSRAIGQR
jgi:predicted DNA-binding transcriptional regulator YafY